MAFGCCAHRSGVITVGIIDLLGGIILIYLAAKTVIDPYKPLPILESTGNSTINSETTVQPSVSNGTSDSSGPWDIDLHDLWEFWTPLLGFLFVGISTEIAGVASLLSCLLAINNRKTAMSFAIWATSVHIGCSIVIMILLFITGYHWIEILPILVWEFLQIYFKYFVLTKYSRSSELQNIVYAVPRQSKDQMNENY